VRLDIPGADPLRVHTLRTLADSRAIIAAASVARRALVVGASFIGLEVAASLRARNVEVHVVARDTRPMERILGAKIGDFLRDLHEKSGVVFHLQNTLVRMRGRVAVLEKGEVPDIDMIVVGAGVQPRVSLAERAGIATDRGVLVDDFLETSVPGIFAAGDIARWPNKRTGERVRVEHWVVAQRQGQVAARNMLGRRERFDAVPFFWSQHYDVSINYVGHAEAWDEMRISGEIEHRYCLVEYYQGGSVVAVATINRDHENLAWELSMEGGDHEAGSLASE
jgi:NADPH-dependent 2,4-dienoyl-CoA reductase/sulfur reductase-like enzyme